MDLSDIAELAGLAALLIAAFLFDWRAGIAVAGVVLIALGVLLDDGGEQ